MAEEANNIKRQILADSHELSGLLRVTAPDHAEALLLPVVRKFVQRYPDVSLEIVTTTEELNLSAREADVALRGTNQPPPNLVGKRIAQIAMAVYGVRDLLERASTEPSAHNLPCITWVGDGTSLPPWIEKSFPNTRRVYRTTSFSDLLSRGLRVGMLSGSSYPTVAEPSASSRITRPPVACAGAMSTLNPAANRALEQQHRLAFEVGHLPEGSDCDP